MIRNVNPGWIIAIVTYVIYYLPTWISMLRGHPDADQYGVVNMLIGWTVIGWVILLVHSLSHKWVRCNAPATAKFDEQLP